MQGENLESIKLITSGQCKGRRALEWLHAHGEYVYHGSWQKIELLEPRQAYSYGEPDGEPAVCAAVEYDTAIFRALINRHRDAAQGIKHASRFYCHNGNMHFGATQESLDVVHGQQAVGYVHVLDQSDFKQFRGSEFRSLMTVAPLYIIEVTGSDLPDGIEIISQQDTRLGMEDRGQDAKSRGV